jgi:ribonuclease D
MITRPSQLLELVVEAQKAEAIALDTEFFWERTYYPRLGLIQLAIADDEQYLIDPLAIEDLRPLGEVLARRDLVKIFHDAGQDLTILHRATGVAAQNVFDTRLAAGFANLSSTLSLASLVRELLDIDLAKTETRSDWLRRPLSHEQQEYAKNDVRYLRALRLLLLRRITSPKVNAWLDEELALYSKPRADLADGSNCYLKLRGAAALPPAGAAILKQLCDWREETARASDKPKGHIIPDAGLLAIAHQAPANIPALRDLGLSSQAISRYGRAIIALCAAAQAAPAERTAEEKPWRLSAKEKERYDRLRNMIRLKSQFLGIDPALVGNSDELRAVARFLVGGVAPAENLRQLSGWRMTFLEDFCHHNV